MIKKNFIDDSDFEELYYYEQSYPIRSAHGCYVSNPENIVVSLEIDENETIEKHISIVKEFLKNIDKYKEIAKHEICAEMIIEIGQFIGVLYNKDEFELLYTGNNDQGFKLSAFFNINGKFINADLFL